MAREDPQFRIRLPANLKGRVEEAAAASQRSLNAEIVHRLEASFLREPAIYEDRPPVTESELTRAVRAWQENAERLGQKLDKLDILERLIDEQARLKAEKASEQ